ncbi:MAG: S8 family serine peptidase [Candidatus Zixiibacteriota bacterium]
MIKQLSLHITVFAALLSLAAADSFASQKLTPHLQELAQSSVPVGNDSVIEVIVFIQQSQLTDNISQSTSQPNLSRGERIARVHRQLTSFQSQALSRVESVLNRVSIVPIRRLWIVPSFVATVPATELASLAALDDVAEIVENAAIVFEQPVDTGIGSAALSTAVSTQLSRLNVPALWSRGLKGKGRLVCSFDTGVEKVHPGLSDKWRGNHAPLASTWFSKVVPDSLPRDLAGHGTHTMGVMVGAMPGDSFGVAPEAEWMTAGVIDQGRPFQTTLSDILEAFQWALNPDGNPATTDDVPDVILNSWGVPKGLFAPCDATFWTAIDNVEAAGIVTIFAAGNEGPNPKTLRSPADRASTPLNSFAVGAVDDANVVASFSSRGPSSCDTTQIKPEVVAPGVSIRSSWRGGGFNLMTGTSMAAPYIAGLAILARQYNPDATVAEIKQAIIQSCTDLGAFGNDNAYGNGFPNALEMINALTPPQSPLFQIAQVSIGGDGIALPGEQVAVHIILTNAIGNMESVAASILSSSGDVSLGASQTGFFFGTGGTVAVSAPDLSLTFDPASVHGDSRTFSLVLFNGNTIFDTLEFQLTVGIPPAGAIADHSTSRLRTSVSDFGQFGFGPGSIYNAGGHGVRLDEGGNILYEAGIVVGRNALQLSSALRDSLGNARSSEFTPKIALSGSILSAGGSSRRTAQYQDTQSDIPIPITVSQESVTWESLGEENALLVRFHLVNESNDIQTNLWLGFLADFDLSLSDKANYDADLRLVWLEAPNGTAAGVVLLKNLTNVQALTNATGKVGFTTSQLYGMLSTTGIHVDPQTSADRMLFASGGSFSLSARDSVEIALAMVAGSSVADLFSTAQKVRQRFEGVTGVDDPPSVLPSAFHLYQNYPNPFNPSTTIAFDLLRSADVHLTVFNCLGQHVATLVQGHLGVGHHETLWSGKNDNGQTVASGLYYYRLVGNDQAVTRKMLLVK